MSLCILAAGKMTVLAVGAFTLAWTHSVQKTRWEEDWQVTAAGLVVTEARIESSGAGMDPPEGSVFDGRVWHYKPKVPPVPKVLLARSGAVGPWRLCSAQGCMDFDGPGAGGDPVELSACP
jgi:hypothetical protein